MKTKIQFLATLILISNGLCLKTSAQSLKPTVIASCGGYFTGGGKSLSWTMGETITQTLQGGNSKLTQGFQQPEIIVTILNLRAFIQGFYRGSGQMLAVSSPISNPTVCDTVTISIASATTPYAIIQTRKAVINTSGNGSFTFNNIAYKNYYLVIRHRNALETWSKTPISFNANSISYDFTNAATKAFGDNQISFGDGSFGIWSGDVTNGTTPGIQDGSIAITDLTEIGNSSQLFSNGYLVDDLNGDGFVEAADYSLVENNVSLLVGIVRP